jgi:acyl-CoA thioesterase-1
MNLVFILVWLIGHVFPAVMVETKAVIFYGDSITAGYGIGTEFAFPNLIGERLKENGVEVEVVNAGLSGETSAGGLTRIDWMLNRKFDVFVLELGANDGLRGIPVAETKKNLQAIIDKVKSKYPDTKIVIAGMMVPPNMGQDYAQSFEGVFKEIASQNNAALIPFLLKDVGGVEALNQPDGIHPNVQGHKIIAENVYPLIQALL